VSRGRETTIGYLPQEVAASRADSVLDEALGGFDEVWRLEREMAEVASALERAPRSELTERYGELQHRFEALGGYRLETEAKAILGGLGFRADDLGRPLAEFSGGWRMRAALARLLLRRPSLLLLDEPTNHLDLESLGWLESVLAGWDGAVVIVAHDRYFLNRMVTAIAELGPGGLTLYPGTYDDFLVEREARRALLESRAANQARRVAEIERFIARFRYQATKARQVQSRIKMLERLPRVTVASETRGVRFAFPAPPRTGRQVVTLAGAHRAYGENVVYAGVDIVVERGERVGLVGPNGAGKSTLLRMLAGVLPLDRGERRLGAHVTVQYYAQHQVDALDPDRTVLEELTRAAPDLGHTRIRTILGGFLFGGDTVEKTVRVLSGGEKARLALARMLARPAPLLCLDEPTNHLDLAAREVLERALAAFAGTIVVVSHDRYFLNRITTRIVEIERGRLTSYPGDYDDYLAAKARGGDDAGTEGETRRGPEGAPPARTAKAPRTPRVSSELRELRRRLDEVERQIQALEARLAQLGDTLADPALYADGARARAIALERKRAEEEVGGLMREWEAISTALAAHE
jgi:ATP-binding cassette subfamily F protein 3